MNNKQWIEYGKSLREFRLEGLYKVGTQYRLIKDIYFKKERVTQEYTNLIGDVNSNGGGCNCCADRDEEIVLKYRVLLTEEDLED